jgi:acyl-CoA synthetase (AMP-forming)/AMP-acid ligase II
VVDEPGVAGSTGTLTYADMAASARGMALALDDLGVEHGERVAIVSPNSVRFLTSFFGVSGYGRILVPINFRLTRDEIAYVVEHSGASVLLYDPDLADEVDTIKVAHKFRMDGTDDGALFAPAPEGATPAVWTADEDATCSVNYTSGTTARPKGVQLTHRNCWLNAAVFGWHTGVSDRDVLLHTLPMFHCNGWGMPYAVTGMGGTHVVLRKVDGEEILTRIERHGVTLMCGAPAVVAAILGAAEARVAEGRTVPGRGTVRIVVAGAPPPSKTIERVETELGWEFIQIYGLTETAPLLTINRTRSEWDALRAGERSQLLSRAGVPAMGVRIAVDTDGEVLAQSNHVFAGYWEQPRETAAALEGGWFHTGDGGHLDGAHTVIADRKKDVIITGGENVSSIEVEDCLYQHDAVAEVAVIGVPDEKWGETIKALVVVREGTTTSEIELIAHCRDRLAHFKAPTSVEFRDALDRTATGKLQKYKLRQTYWAGREKAVN